jgi:hypothetical protein
MKPLTGKELEYIVDSMANEDLLIKQCINAFIHTNNPLVKQEVSKLTTSLQQHNQKLMGLLSQHLDIAPKTLEEAQAYSTQQQQQMQPHIQQFNQQNMQPNNQQFNQLNQ